MQNAWLIVGLGNPGRAYQTTRHNAGYMVLEALARRWRARWSNSARFRAQVARAKRDDKQVVLGRPTTFMNASGQAVKPLAAYYKVPPGQILVVADDADLPLGTLRMRPGGGSGGHHGLESVEQHLASRDYCRLRLGIGRTGPGAREITDYVLSPFQADELGLLKTVVGHACDQIECWLADGVQMAMNRFNRLIEN